MTEKFAPQNEALESRVQDIRVEEILPFARELTPHERAIITQVNGVTDEILSAYHARTVPVIAEKIFMIPEEQWPTAFQKRDIYGFYASTHDVILMRERLSANADALVMYITHEIVHLKEFHAFVEEDNTLSPVRAGLRSRTKSSSREEKFIYPFSTFDEAVVEELTKRVLFAMLDKQSLKQIEQEKNMRFKKGDNDHYLQIVNSIKDGTRAIEFYGGYIPERQLLHLFIKKLYRHNKDRFKNQEEIFDMFARAAFAGQGLELVKLIERTYGKGVTRDFAALEGHLDEQEAFIQSLP